MQHVGHDVRHSLWKRWSGLTIARGDRGAGVSRTDIPRPWIQAEAPWRQGPYAHDRSDGEHLNPSAYLSDASEDFVQDFVTEIVNDDPARQMFPGFDLAHDLVDAPHFDDTPRRRSRAGHSRESPAAPAGVSLGARDLWRGQDLARPCPAVVGAAELKRGGRWARPRPADKHLHAEFVHTQDCSSRRTSVQPPRCLQASFVLQS